MQILNRALVTVFACAPLCAQLSGNYAVDPTAPAAFPSLGAAVAALVAQGVNGPVEIEIAPGTYVESLLIDPIAGASPMNTVTFRPMASAGSVVLQGATGDTVALLGSAGQSNSSLVFDGLTFDGAPGHAISATSYVEDIEIRNCRFEGSHITTAPLQLTQSVIEADLAGNEIGWRVHHNQIKATAAGVWPASSCLTMHGAGGWEIHHNTFDLDGAHHAIDMHNNSSRVDRIYNNLFHGTPAINSSNVIASVAVIRADLANYENYITHNTFAVDFGAGGSGGCCIASGGTVVGGTVVQNYIRGNVFLVRGLGYAVSLNVSGFGQNPIDADGNVYFGPAATLFRIGSAIGNGIDHTLASWQAATGSDAVSTFADPLLRAPFANMPDLRPLPASPVVGAAVNTPPYVVDDFGGRLRDANPDAGAHESTSFATFGDGCPGSGQQTPQMDSWGALAIGSPTFTLGLSQARPTTTALLSGGASRQSWLGTPLPLDLGGGCELLVSADASLTFVTSSTGTAAAPLPIPNNPQLLGGDLFFQWVVLDPASASSLGVAVSDAGAVQL